MNNDITIRVKVQWYIGLRHNGVRETFPAFALPTEETYGDTYAMAEGPFESKIAAKYFCNAMVESDTSYAA